MATTIISILALLVSSSSVVWTVWYNRRQVRVQSVQLTRDLFGLYYSKDMLKSRDKAWFELESLNQGGEPLIFSDLWKDSQTEARDRFDHIQHVLQFWFQLYALDKKQLLDRELAAELLGHHYIHWKEQFRKLVKDTQQNDPDPPHSISAFTSNELQWLRDLSNARTISNAHNK